MSKFRILSKTEGDPVATRSARKRNQLRMMLDKPGQVVIIAIPLGRKPYYEISLGTVKAIAEWRGYRVSARSHNW